MSTSLFLEAINNLSYMVKGTLPVWLTKYLEMGILLWIICVNPVKSQALYNREAKGSKIQMKAMGQGKQKGKELMLLRSNESRNAGSF